jgi:hypothetical protein
LQTKDPKDIFLEKKFPQILECDVVPHDAVFIPDSFADVAEKAGAAKEGNNLLLLFNDNNLIASLLKNAAKNTVVINGWSDRTPSGIVKSEYDFLIVSEPLRTIFHIEEKKTCKLRTCKSAVKMLVRGRNTLQDSIQFPKEEKWNYVGILYFEHDTKKHSIFCPECQRFVLGPTNDIWADITKNIEKPALSKSSNKTYLDVLKFLLYEMQRKRSTTNQPIKGTRKITGEDKSDGIFIFLLYF